MIDYALLMYGASEREILETWSLETIVSKVKNGFAFEVLKTSGSVETERESERELLTHEEERELYELYE